MSIMEKVEQLNQNVRDELEKIYGKKMGFVLLIVPGKVHSGEPYTTLINTNLPQNILVKEMEGCAKQIDDAKDIKVGGHG